MEGQRGYLLNKFAGDTEMGGVADTPKGCAALQKGHVLQDDPA